MNNKHIGRQTVALANPPVITAWASTVGKLEGEGPLGRCFDHISPDSYFGQDSWEKGESEMLKRTFLYCKAVRDRYTIFQLAWDLGLLDELSDEVIASL